MQLLEALPSLYVVAAYLCAGYGGRDVLQLHSAETRVAGKVGCFMNPCSVFLICPGGLHPVECA